MKEAKILQEVNNPSNSDQSYTLVEHPEVVEVVPKRTTVTKTLEYWFKVTLSERGTLRLRMPKIEDNILEYSVIVYTSEQFVELSYMLGSCIYRDNKIQPILSTLLDLVEVFDPDTYTIYLTIKTERTELHGMHVG